MTRPGHPCQRRRWAIAATLAVVVALAAGAACSAGTGASIEPTSTTFAGRPPALPAATTDAVARLVAAYGTGPVAATRYAFGTYHQALRVLGLGDLPKSAPDTDVFVVTIDGSFALASAGTTKDTFSPKGRYLVAMFRQATPAEPLQVGVTDLAPPLDRVGQVAVVSVSS